MNSLKQFSVPRSAFRVPRFLLALLLLLVLAPPPARTQYNPVQAPNAVTGSTLGQNLRNAAFATQNQLNLLRTATDNWLRRAQSVNYTDPHFRQDYDNISWHYQGLRTQFNYLGELALQLGRPRADNAIAELNAGLDIIAELFVFLSEEYGAGRLDRATVVRTAGIFQKAIREWEHELRKNSSRMGLVW